ncbi:hypothetical protein CCACVL1_14590 [Corchorus capsularis]|uniref:Neprosin PEP catalytic domain-containing protein n=1 Tax=Corchorus capsularis TaxID=210143 RepID=A0A1R3I6P2_COCAP|nr:hypothetical protein CCACVL1_14590 [Corchorus capsularis]
MGTGKYPEPNIQIWKSGYFIRARYVNEHYKLVDAEPDRMVKYLNSDSSCYRLLYYTYPSVFNQVVRYGGPGGTAIECRWIPPLLSK